MSESGGNVQLSPGIQIGMVVRDLDRVAAFYSATFGVGPWRILELDTPEVQVRDKVYPWKRRIAFTKLGAVELELIQNLGGRSIHSEFLEEGREGLHHIGLYVTREEKENLTAQMAKAGMGVIQGGKSPIHSGSYAYVDTQKTGGVMFELLHKPSD